MSLNQKSRARRVLAKSHSKFVEETHCATILDVHCGINSAIERPFGCSRREIGEKFWRRKRLELPNEAVASGR